MSIDHLSENHADWPVDPFELLGVKRGADQREVKRAYANLIRRFKPEHHPEEFRKIRSAYEDVLNHIHWGSYEDDEIVHSEELAVASVSHQEDAESSRSAPSFAVKSTPWDDAIKGNFQKAFDALQADQRRNPTDEDAAVQLYWLARIRPEVANSKAPVDFLHTWLTHQGIRGRAGQLFIQALTLAPEESISATNWALATNPESRSYLHQFLRIRWQQQLRLEQSSILLDELSELEPLYVDHHLGWMDLVSMALHLASRTGTLDADKVVQACTAIFQSNGELGLRAPYLFDRAEEDLYVFRFLRTMRQLGGAGLPTRVRKLIFQIAQLNLCTPAVGRMELKQVISGWLSDPMSILDELDIVMQKCHPLMAELCHSVDQLYYNEVNLTPLFQDDELRECLLADQSIIKLYIGNIGGYARLRKNILAFCLDHVADPVAVISTLEEIAGSNGMAGSPCSNPLTHDYPLRSLIRGHLICWN